MPKLYPINNSRYCGTKLAYLCPMKFLFKKLFIVVLASFVSKSTFAQKEHIWAPVHILTFNHLKADALILVHDSFIKPEKRALHSLNQTDIPSALHLKQQKNQLIFSADLAEGNPMLWQFEIVNDSTATWKNLACECNVGLESAVFGSMSNPYKKEIATLHLQKDGTVKVQYTEQFKKDILSKTSFSRAFFKDQYDVFMLVEN